MRTFIIGFVVFLIYSIPATWHYTCQIRNLCGDNTIVEDDTKNPKNNLALSLEDSLFLTNRTNDLSIKIGDSILLTNQDQFGFLPNSAKLNLTDNNKVLLGNMATYLKENPEARLEIVGSYFEDEKVTSGTLDNLGLARADAIRKYLMSEYDFKSDRFKIDYEAIERGDENHLFDLAIKMNDSTLFAKSDSFNFAFNSAKLNLTDNNKDFLKEMGSRLRENPKAKMEIVGSYFEGENVTSGTSADLGLARATAIRDFLIDKYNFKSNQFILDSKKVERGSEAYLDRPLEYDIIVPNIKPNTKPKGKNEEVLVEASYTFERMTFSDINFEYNSDKFMPSNSFSVYADSVKKHLELFPEKKLTIVGHADNRGTEDYNYGLGLSRANNVIIYLRDNKKIEIERIDSDSKGEKKPIVPNTTESNMRKNRRVEVIIK